MQFPCANKLTVDEAIEQIDGVDDVNVTAKFEVEVAVRLAVEALFLF